MRLSHLCDFTLGRVIVTDVSVQPIKKHFSSRCVLKFLNGKDWFT
jgi:hypothetical protein